jgi:hypothetical protein
MVQLYRARDRRYLECVVNAVLIEEALACGVREMALLSH